MGRITDKPVSAVQPEQVEAVPVGIDDVAEPIAVVHNSRRSSTSSDADRPVAHPPIADLHHDGVDEQHRVNRLSSSCPLTPLGHLLDHLVDDPGDSVLAHRRAIDLGEARGDLPAVNPNAVCDWTI